MSLTPKDSHTKHISQQFNAELSSLRDRLLRMGGLVEKQVADAVNALLTGDGKLAGEVRARELEVDKLELVIDEQCTAVIALRQPAASDLRMVMSVVKMVSDLERIGDEANKVAKMALNLIAEGALPEADVEVRHISEHVLIMVRQALDAFARHDSSLALQVMREDKKVDQEYKSAMRSLVTFMMEDPRSISRVMSVIWVLRALERIGDHAGNIGEHIIYMVDGKDVRHAGFDEAEKVVERKR